MGLQGWEGLRGVGGHPKHSCRLTGGTLSHWQKRTQAASAPPAGLPAPTAAGQGKWAMIFLLIFQSRFFIVPTRQEAFYPPAIHLLTLLRVIAHSKALSEVPGSQLVEHKRWALWEVLTLLISATSDEGLPSPILQGNWAQEGCDMWKRGSHGHPA